MNGAKPELVIRVDLETAAGTMAEELEKLFEAYPGSNPLVLELTRPGNFRARLRPGHPRAVNAQDELLARLRELCGPDAVVLQKQSSEGR
jgi:hypothetical protein